MTRVTPNRLETDPCPWSVVGGDWCRGVHAPKRRSAALCGSTDCGPWRPLQPQRTRPRPDAPARLVKRAGMTAVPVCSIVDAVHPLIEAEADPSRRITVPEVVRITHALLKGTREMWRRQRSRHVPWDAPRPAHLTVNVAQDNERRALQLLQVLFSALEARGHRVAAGDKGEIRVTVLDETCTMVLRERLRQDRTAAVTTPGFRSKPYELVPTGEFELRVECFPGGYWRDKRDHRVETDLNGVVVALLEGASSAKARRAERERQRLAEEEQERQRAVVRQRRKEERRRIRSLGELAKAVDRHRQLVSAVAALKDAIGSTPPESRLTTWLQWVDRYVARTDVLQRFRDRASRFTVYYCGSSWQVENIARKGFEASDATSDADDLSGFVTLTDVELESRHGGSACLAFDVTEDDVLPYETIQSEADYRTFVVPVAIANEFARARLPNDTQQPA